MIKSRVIPEQVYTAKEVSAFTSLGINKVRELMRLNHIKSFRMGSRGKAGSGELKTTVKDMNNFIEQMRAGIAIKSDKPEIFGEWLINTLPQQIIHNN